MRKTILAILICCCLIAMHTTALAAGGITVTVSPSKAEAGDSITVSGTATADTWISIEGTDADGNILYFSAALSDAAGAYSVTLKVPEMDDGTLTLTAGNGSMTASTTVKIYTASPPVTPAHTAAAMVTPEPSAKATTTPEPSAIATMTPAPAVTVTGSAQAIQSFEVSKAPENTGIVVPSVTPAASEEVLGDAIQTGDAANSQFPTGNLVWILICVFVLLLIVGVILFLRKRKRM